MAKGFWLSHADRLVWWRGQHGFVPNGKPVGEDYWRDAPRRFD
jgi:hypothetical protein